MAKSNKVKETKTKKEKVVEVEKIEDLPLDAKPPFIEKVEKDIEEAHKNPIVSDEKQVEELEGLQGGDLEPISEHPIVEDEPKSPKKGKKGKNSQEEVVKRIMEDTEVALTIRKRLVRNYTLKGREDLVADYMK